MRHEINTINFGSRYCNGKNTYRLLACEYAWKRVHFRRSKCCFARVMDAKVVQNHTPSAEILWILTRKLLESIKNPRKWTHLIAIRFLVAIRTMRKNVEIRENLRKSSKILDEYPTKINEKSCFEHVQVTLCKITWFSRPERLWSRSSNTLPQSPKFNGFWPENCTNPSKSTKINGFDSNSEFASW